MVPTIYRKRAGLMKGAVAIAAALILVGFAGGSSHAAKVSEKTFHSPEEAFTEMVAAMREGNERRLSAVFGAESKALFPAAEGTRGETYAEFLKAYEEKKRVEMAGDGKAVLHVGNNDWSWPIPVVKAGKLWHFDTRAGKKEILARRIGQNEVAAVQVCLAYVDAQREYAQDQRAAKGVAEYARKFASADGMKDGLHWEAKEGAKESPLGPAVAQACRVSFSGEQLGGSPPKPYHGYFYKILTRQGAHAAGGTYDYVVDGKMIGGFALVAYPAAYGSTGIMTFIVNQDGIVYQKNLGKETVRSAEAMTSFDPDKSWTRVD
ncbi:MAG: DUF2950 domain-containing protein [Deltaproteobacteria bacterium]|nr:DUF2950 domain-containing protein [Deltaproteobacteria bacterium]